MPLGVNSLATDVEKVEDAELTPNTEVLLEPGKGENSSSCNFDMLECAKLLPGRSQCNLNVRLCQDTEGIGGELANFGCALHS